MNSKGQFLIIALCLVSLLFLSAIPLSQNVFLNIKDSRMFLERDKAFYLARAGLSKAAWRVKKESWPGSHSELSDSQVKTLLSSTNEGIEEYVGDGGFRYIKIIGEDKIYVMGFCGKNAAHAKSRIFLKGTGEKWRIF